MTKKLTISQLIASCFFLGHAPIGPGTVASLVAMIVHYFVPFSLIMHFVILNALFIVGAIVSEKVVLETKTKDAPFIVIDEWFGMWLALFLAPHNIWIYLIAFVTFRFFDILKPSPISYIENNTPGGLGVMLDDAAAGFFTFCVVQLVTFFV